MGMIRSFRELDVYRLAREQSRVIFRVTRSFPKDETYSLTDQIRRSSRAVNAMLAEAWARRRYVTAFANKINEPLGEAMETQGWLDRALDCEYINVARHSEMDAKWHHVGGMLNRMIDTDGSICKSPPTALRKNRRL